MIRGIFTSATGMIMQQKKLDVIGNNIANDQTSGFKSDEVSLRSFDQEMIQRMSEDVQVGSMTYGVTSDGIKTDFSNGNYSQTNSATDIAIVGNGYFAVQDGNNGVKYTRDGGFTVDSAGYLALPSGERLLGTNGQPLKVSGDQFSLSSDGVVRNKSGAVGQIAVYQPTGQIVKRGDGFMQMTGASQIKGTLRQGFLEGSNVDIVTQMSQMMVATRSYQSNQQSFKTADQTLEKLVNQVGSMR
ncbi:MAG TPA: flagellar hook-basal body protein [Clostridia bacterium]|nr:flagellar hook-basal body protein [Clostridia bacterium]